MAIRESLSLALWSSQDVFLFLRRKKYCSVRGNSTFCIPDRKEYDTRDEKMW